MSFDGRVYLFSIVHDITAKARLEKQLVESQSRLLTAESFAKYGHWIFNLSNNVVEASDGARELYGIGSRIWSIREVQTIPLPEYRDLLDTALKDLITKNKPYNVFFKIKRPADGKIIDIQSTAKYDSENNTVFGIIQDVTEQTEATELLKKVQ